MILTATSAVDVENNDISIENNTTTTIEIEQTDPGQSLEITNISHQHTSLDKIIKTTLQATITANGGTYTDLQTIIDSAQDGDTISINGDYTYNSGTDYNLINGVKINKNLTIEGNNHKINGLSEARIFRITSNNIIIKDLNLINGTTPQDYSIYKGQSSQGINTYDYYLYLGGAIYATGYGNLTIINCKFIDNKVISYYHQSQTSSRTRASSTSSWSGYTVTSNYYEYYTGSGGSIYSELNLNIIDSSFSGAYLLNPYSSASSGYTYSPTNPTSSTLTQYRYYNIYRNNDVSGGAVYARGNLTIKDSNSIRGFYINGSSSVDFNNFFINAGSVEIFNASDVILITLNLLDIVILDCLECLEHMLILQILFLQILQIISFISIW